MLQFLMLPVVVFLTAIARKKQREAERGVSFDNVIPPANPRKVVSRIDEEDEVA